MAKKIVVIDFAGTLIPPHIIDEAQKLRSEVLHRSLPTREEHAHEEDLYEKNREKVAKLLGITDGMKFEYTTNSGETIELTAKQFENQISTNLFQMGLLIAAKQHGKETIKEGFADVLEEIKHRGYRLAIVSGVRTDIVSSVMNVAGYPDLIDYNFGQPPILGISNAEQLNALSGHGEIAYVIGDKVKDLDPAADHGAESIFAMWGTPSGGEEALADHSVNNPQEILDIIQDE